MDIVLYEQILKGLKDYNDSVGENFGNVVLAYPTVEPTYPYTVVEEIRNVTNPKFKSFRDKVANMGYRVDIYSKTKGLVSKQTIARTIAKQVDEFFTSYVGLTQNSWNISELENDSSLYHIVVTYTGSLHENRRKIL